MKQKDLPQRWQTRITEYLKETGSKFNEFGFNDFQNDLKITFVDNSNAFFYYSFYWIDVETKEIAVFTEHCGYHIFPLFIKIETIDKDEKIIKTEDYRVE